ncbi:MAG TPA: type II toxin-antitoxin system RelE/ParE family toxin [Candidatus Sulfotelmatobacter sp.]|nr:type II toxin-antitoxin system RelE/ParE family toxin [Candidatus Sulfotelmatobacter sp.]
MSGFVFHPEAISDLEEIWEFIANDNLDAADRVLKEIRGTIELLASYPHTGHVRADLASPSFLFHPVRGFLIAYAAEEDPTVVLAILHGRRNPRIIGALLRGRE